VRLGLVDGARQAAFRDGDVGRWTSMTANEARQTDESLAVSYEEHAVCQRACCANEASVLEEGPGGLIDTDRLAAQGALLAAAAAVQAKVRGRIPRG
jgi:hypothetical protein